MLRRIIDEGRLAPLDLVIDDASHLYRLSRRAFELLFPRLRPGGLCALEDWSWSFWPQNKGGDSVNTTQVPLVRLVSDLLAVMGSGRGLIARIDVYQDFVIVKNAATNPSTTRWCSTSSSKYVTGRRCRGESLRSRERRPRVCCVASPG